MVQFICSSSYLHCLTSDINKLCINDTKRLYLLWPDLLQNSLTVVVKGLMSLLVDCVKYISGFDIDNILPILTKTLQSVKLTKYVLNDT